MFSCTNTQCPRKAFSRVGSIPITINTLNGEMPAIALTCPYCKCIVNVIPDPNLYLPMIDKEFQDFKKNIPEVDVIAQKIAAYLKGQS